ncbi:MAG: hypothetical protein V4510_06450 [bacterium]
MLDGNASMERIELLAAKRIADAYLASMPQLDGKALSGRIVQGIVNRMGAEKDGAAEKSFSQRIVETAAAQLVRDQRAEAAEEERVKMLRAIRSATAPQILVELKTLAEAERVGAIKGAKIPLLNKAYQKYGSYALVLHAVEAM